MHTASSELPVCKSVQLLEVAGKYLAGIMILLFGADLPETPLPPVRLGL
jgi:hypothetical protein